MPAVKGSILLGSVVVIVLLADAHLTLVTNNIQGGEKLKSRESTFAIFSSQTLHLAAPLLAYSVLKSFRSVSSVTSP